ncbi:hypothetical protein [Gordonia sp. (in: high G+C Gram-positive bacteria)]|uniref:hypothetical protein n=1 Tax=Gordonia sp. (in: high G+C Gram-positive bacteria) TaxID=84139 RepID=UPI0039E2BB52
MRTTAAIVSALGAALLVGGCAGHPAGPSAAPGDRATIVVNSGDSEFASLQRWAREVNAGDVDAVTRKCWTMPPEYIRERYFGATSAVAAALSTEPQQGQAGTNWKGPSGATILLTWDEDKSPYACPKVSLAAGDDAPDYYVAYRVRRFILREQGRPINPGDNEASYWLRCALPVDRGEVANVDRADADDVRVSMAGDHKWTATAGPVTFDVAYEPAEPCISSAR